MVKVGKIEATPTDAAYVGHTEINGTHVIMLMRVFNSIVADDFDTLKQLKDDPVFRQLHDLWAQAAMELLKDVAPAELLPAISAMATMMWSLDDE